MLDRDAAVRLEVYRHFIDHQRAPALRDLAGTLGLSHGEVRESLRQLGAGRALVLEPDGTGIRMAEPFSAVPTSFRVTIGERSWWANCAWDALGIPAMFHADASIATRCADCDQPAGLDIEGGRLRDTSGMVHVLVPAARWWDDIVFT